MVEAGHLLQGDRLHGLLLLHEVVLVVVGQVRLYILLLHSVRVCDQL